MVANCLVAVVVIIIVVVRLTVIAAVTRAPRTTPILLPNCRNLSLSGLNETFAVYPTRAPGPVLENSATRGPPASCHPFRGNKQSEKGVHPRLAKCGDIQESNSLSRARASSETEASKPSKLFH